jgi:hypothetical protein
MLATLVAFLVVFGASALVGQAILAVAGEVRWSALAPAVGLAALLALAWATVRLPGEGTAAAVAVGIAVIAAIVVLSARRPLAGEVAARDALLAALGAVALALLPFLVEGRFGVLGTGLNPDMSQHLFAADRLANDGVERLISEGYPLGPHALVVAIGAIGPSLVHSFDGLMVSIAVASALAAIAALGGARAPWLRIGGALVVAFAYLLASNYIQGAFKEGIQSLFVLAFAVALGRVGSERRLAALPLAVLAIGSVYAYSFPGLAWIAGTLGAWAAIRLGREAFGQGGREAALAAIRRAAAPALVALAVFAAAVAPELGRISSFASFETFDPDGAGLGNLFDRLSPLEALGIWPSGDFRVEPGDGAAPAIVFWLGAALGGAALAFGVRWAARRGGGAALAALAAAAVLWLYSLVAGTPYQEAKALVIAAPLVALVAGRALVAAAPALAAAAFLLAAGASGVLALANGPVGPSGYSPELAELRDELGPSSTVVSAPSELLDEQHGRDWLVWELRGNRICVEEAAAGADVAAPAGSSLLSVALDDDGAIVPEGLHRNRSPGPGGEPCPLIADGARADPAGDG